MIYPNHRDDIQVAAGLGNRDRTREELPLSTRVHELAKELGLKSQELLERIQKWGLDVKANPLASLDPPMVDRIRELMGQPGGRRFAGCGSAAAACPAAGAPSQQRDRPRLRRWATRRRMPHVPPASPEPEWLPRVRREGMQAPVRSR